MFGMGNGRRGRGLPRRRWMDEVVETNGSATEGSGSRQGERQRCDQGTSPGDVCMKQRDKVY